MFYLPPLLYTSLPSSYIYLSISLAIAPYFSSQSFQTSLRSHNFQVQEYPTPTSQSVPKPSAGYKNGLAASKPTKTKSPPSSYIPHPTPPHRHHHGVSSPRPQPSRTPPTRTTGNGSRRCWTLRSLLRSRLRIRRARRAVCRRWRGGMRII